MISLLVNGQPLDLTLGSDVATTKSNCLFAFDKLSTERTATFKVPATPANNRIFNLANDVRMDGGKARVKLAAVMTDGAVQKSGYLYITSCDGISYSCTFTMGDLLALKDMKDAGKLSEYLDLTDIYTYGVDQVMSANNESLKSLLYAAMTYYTNGHISPSFNLAMLIQRTCARFGVSVDVPSELKEYRIAPSELRRSDEEEARLHSIHNEDDEDVCNTIYPAQLLKYIITEQLFTESIHISYRKGHNNPTGQIISTEDIPHTIRRFYTPNAITITFPSDITYKYYLIVADHDHAGILGQFWGGYSFNKTTVQVGQTYITRTGEPLAGRGVEIPADSYFLLVNEDDYTCEAVNTYKDSDAVTMVSRGYDFSKDTALSYNFKVVVKATTEDVVNGEVIRAIDNLPDVTAIDLLKSAAAVLGKCLYYDGVTISFEDLAMDTWNTKELKKIISRSDIKRSFSDYAQANIVSFDSDDSVPTIERISRTYAVVNECIDSEKDLLIVPFTEGGEYKDNIKCISIADDNSKYIIMCMSNGTTSAAFRPSLPEIEGITQLCDASTSVTIKLPMTSFEFEQITPKVIILWNGCRWVWTEAQRSKGVATIKLSKI